MDLSVLATPLYVAAMRFEHRRLARRPGPPDAAQYTRSDTATSLGMGVLSLLTPLTLAAAKRAVPRRGGGVFGGVVGATTVVAAIATTVADRAARSADRATSSGSRRHRRARTVAAAGGITATAGGVLMASGASALAGNAGHHWKVRGASRDLGNGVVAWTAAMVWWDLVYYWNHRLIHEVRALWAIHVPHHSSEHYNLSTALRQPAAGAFGVFLPYGIAARVGIRPALIETSRSLNLIYQFWIHTDLVRRMGRAEAVLNTPSHHRVHHGSNHRYLDRNHGGILIVWDRLFGTYQPELTDTDPVVYGLTRNIGTDNLWHVTTHEYRDIARDVAASEGWRDRAGFVMRGPGWATRRRAELAMSRRAEFAMSRRAELAMSRRAAWA